MDRHLLIDGNNLLHRAFHAFVENAVGFKSDFGYPTGMIYGPLSMLADWMPSLGRFDAIHFFNDGNPSRRRAMDPSYKVRDRPYLAGVVAHSITLADGFEARDEISVLFHILKLLSVSIYAEADEEADDLIASFVKANPNDVHIVLSSDKDFFQLLTNPRVAICRPGARGPKFLDAEGAEKHWASLNQGSHPPVPVDCTRIFKSLCGDPSDNIPGVFRLRKKVAVAAAMQCDCSIDKLIENDWPGFSPLEKERAREMIDRIKLNWELVGLIDDLTVEPIRDVQPNHKMAADILKTLSIHLDVSFLVPSRMRTVTNDAPVKVLGDDWTSSI